MSMPLLVYHHPEDGLHVSRSLGFEVVPPCYEGEFRVGPAAGGLSPSLRTAALLPPRDVMAPAPVSSEEVLSLDKDEGEVDSENNGLSSSSSLPLLLPCPLLARLFPFSALLRGALCAVRAQCNYLGV